MKKNKLTGSLYTAASTVLLFFAIALSSCSKDNSGDNSNGSGSAATTIKLTDAPIDDASVSGAFVTISDVKVDGISVTGFTKTTIDLAAYQNGATKAIGNFNLAAKTYSTITFVLDFDTDANGDAPGCYILTSGTVAAKHKLQSSSNIITLNRNFTLIASGTNELIADFDLRKMIIHQSGGGADRYDFATSAELQNDIRVEVETGSISGTLTDNVAGGSGKVIVYAYKKGTFNRTTELNGQGASNVQFSNAVTSALVGPGGAYQLHFLESGAYELYFASYKDTNSDGEYEFQGTLVALAAGSLDLLNLNIALNAGITVNATATAILP